MSKKVKADHCLERLLWWFQVELKRPFCQMYWSCRKQHLIKYALVNSHLVKAMASSKVWEEKIKV